MKTALLTFTVLLISINFSTAQFSQEPLPYAFNALEPFIDAQTMEIHYTKHHAGYVAKLNEALKETGMENCGDMSVIFSNMSKYSSVIRNNAGGHFNHTLYWKILTPDTSVKPSAKLLKAIEVDFKSMDEFKNKLNKEAAGRFGSGWAWLIVTPENKLAVVSTPNQDNPLMSDSPVKGTPILGIDVWEHAYYLKYKNKRADYLQAIWNIINWETVSKLYDEAMLK
ncbi:MAG: superoxide dismutase [Bacteroidetes bacterium]|nr:superoxide dismutase [Bacteroidota bacterium]